MEQPAKKQRALLFDLLCHGNDMSSEDRREKVLQCLNCLDEIMSKHHRMNTNHHNNNTTTTAAGNCTKRTGELKNSEGQANNTDNTTGGMMMQASLEDATSKKDETKKEPVENVDYLIHTVLPYSDTLAGLCLRYKVSATKLRQMNKFSGSNLLLAPSNLVIPLKKDCDSSVIQVQDKTKPEYKLQAFLQPCPHLRLSERRAYLEMNQWDLDGAIAQAQSDDVWEEQQSPVLKKWPQPGPRRILLNVHTATTTTTKTALAKHKGVSKSFDNELTEPLLEKKKKKTESTTSILELARRNS